jgi:hypothetical protein
MECQEYFVPPLSDGKWKIEHQQNEAALSYMVRSLLPLFGNIPCPQVTVDYRVFLREDGRVMATATDYTKIRFSPFDLWRPYEYIEMVVKHELVHIWMNYHRLDANDSHTHGPIFRRKALEVGAII